MAGLVLDSSIMAQIGIQRIGIVSIIIYCGIVSYILLKMLDMVFGVCVSKDEELEGLDSIAYALLHYGERGYIL